SPLCGCEQSGFARAPTLNTAGTRQRDKRPPFSESFHNLGAWRSKHMRYSIMGNIDVKQVAGCLLAGAMVGAAVALLYAPQEGVQTRRDIRRFGENTVDRLDNLQEAIRDQAAEWVTDLSEVV